MTIGERIKTLRESKEITQENLAKAINSTKQTIYKYENGIVTNIPSDKVEALAVILGCSPAYLMGWEKNSQIADKPIIKTKLIPIVGTVACGTPIFAYENIQEYTSVPETDTVDFALYAKGDSMNRCKIDDGDLVYIRKQSIVENGEVALVLINDEATIKRFYDYGETVVLRPESTNTQHKEQVYSKKDFNILIQGKAIFIRTNVR
jgi:repressor LexA